MMLNVAWIMVAALCMEQSMGYAIPSLDKSDGYSGQQNRPSSWTGKPTDGTAQDPTKRYPTPTTGAGNPYSQGSYGSNNLPTNHWNGGFPGADGKPKPGPDTGSDGTGQQPWNSSDDGHQPWAPMHGNLSSPTDKQPYPAPETDLTQQPGSDLNSTNDGHQAWAPTLGGDQQPTTPVPVLNDTISSPTSKQPFPNDDKNGKADLGSDSGNDGRKPWTPSTGPGGKLPGNFSDDHHPIIPSPDGHVPWPLSNGTLTSPDGKLPGDSSDDGRPWTHPTPVPHGSLSPYPTGQNVSDCPTSGNKFQSPYQDNLNNGTQATNWNGTDASPNGQTPGDKTGAEDKDEDGDDSDDKSGLNGNSTTLPDPHGQVQSPSSKGPHKGDGDDKSPSSQYPQPIYHPVSSPNDKPQPNGGY